MFTLFYLLILEQLLQGLYNLWDGLVWLRLAQRRASGHAGFYSPHVALYCPVKGAEPGFEQNISALLSFDYPDYEIFFTMASADDPARKIIERLAAATKRKINIVIAGRPERLRRESKQSARGGSEGRGRNSMYTFSRIPMGVPAGAGSRASWRRSRIPTSARSQRFAGFSRRRGGFWSALASAWNAPAATYLGEHHRNFCWGGGTAIRRERFEQSNAMEFWSGSVSDDFSLTHALRQSGPSHPVRAGVHGAHDVRLRRGRPAFEFTNRQIIITRVYESRLWALGGFAHALYCGAVLMGVGLYLSGTDYGSDRHSYLLLALAPPVLSMGRGRASPCRDHGSSAGMETKLLADGWIWTFLAALAPFLALWNTIVALFSRQDPLARRTLRASLARTNAHAHALRHSLLRAHVLSVLCLELL
jgi:hypothetical protein